MSITMERTRRRRRATLALVTAGTLAMNAGITTKRADAVTTGQADTPVYAASHSIKTPPLIKAPRFERRRLLDLGAGPDPEPTLDAVAVTLELSADEAHHLRAMLHESVTNDLDLLEDTLHQTALVDEDAVERVALAVRLEVALG